MKIKTTYHLGIIVMLITLFSCQKAELDISVETISFPLTIDLFSSHFNDEQNGYVCGGIKGESGYIYKTEDGGTSWKAIYSSNKFLKDISFYDSHLGYACGDSILILKTEDGGNSWIEMQYSWLPPPDRISPLNSVEIVDDSVIYVTGGSEFAKGIIFRTRNWGWWWNFEMFDNEYSDSHFISHEQGIFCGYGVMTKTSNGGKDYLPIDIKGDFFTAMHFINNNLGFACGYNGGVYKTSDGGNSWEKIYRTNFAGKRVHFNDITFTNSKNGVIVGNNGEVLITKNGGDDWEIVSNFTNENLLSVFSISDGPFWITAEKGFLFKFQL